MKTSNQMTEQACKGSTPQFQSLFSLGTGANNVVGQKTAMSTLRTPANMAMPSNNNNMEQYLQKRVTMLQSKGELSLSASKRLASSHSIQRYGIVQMSMKEVPKAAVSGVDRNVVPKAQLKKQTNHFSKSIGNGFEAAKNVIQEEQKILASTLGIPQPQQITVNSDGTLNQHEFHFDQYFKAQTTSSAKSRNGKVKMDASSVTAAPILTPHPLYEKDFESPEIVKDVVSHEQEEEIVEEVEPDASGNRKDIWEEPIDPKLYKSLKAMTAFTNTYLKRTDTVLCEDLTVSSMVLKGLAHHKMTLGAPLCPCRHYEDPAAEVKDGYWNCPCVPMRDHNECHCMLFLPEDNEFAGKETTIPIETVLASK